jgi:hypothetical protein
MIFRCRCGDSGQQYRGNLKEGLKSPGSHLRVPRTSRKCGTGSYFIPSIGIAQPGNDSPVLFGDDTIQTANGRTSLSKVNLDR